MSPFKDVKEIAYYKNEYIYIEEYEFNLQIKELSADSITICISRSD